MQQLQDRLLNVSLLAGSPAHFAYQARAGSGGSGLNLHFFGGKTIADLVFVNHYLGGSGAWAAADTASIDAALAKAMTDNDLQSVLQQYYGPAISSRMLPSAVLPGPAPATIYKDQVEALVARIHGSGALGDADPGRTVVNIMLPRGVILVDGFSPGFRPPAGTEAEHDRRLRAVVQVGGEDADSRHGLGGYHGSAHVPSGGISTAVYYAVGVYSEAGNGVPVFDQPWKNVSATFYHELNEARTDPDVEDAIRTGDSSRLGWYSAGGGEIGDIPVTEAGTSLALVFTEIELADGSGAVPVQLMWSNKDEGPARRIG
ncbi:MAG TPA: hypothetical protein VGU21_02970 [Streptosporangiaceae bacterium]|nr:hypothetical protein [Streptosporangiaceae bacterium]